MSRRRTDPNIADVALRGLGFLMAPLLVLIGFLILVGGAERLTLSAGWQLALQVPGHYFTWGVGFLVIGFLACYALLLGTSARYLTWLAFSMAGMWFFSLGIFHFVAIFQRDDANLLGPVFWWFFAAIFGVMGIVHSRWLTREEDLDGNPVDTTLPISFVTRPTLFKAFNFLTFFLGFLMGVIMIWGGKHRLPKEFWHYVWQVPHAPVVWGVPPLVAGLLGLVSFVNKRVKRLRSPAAVGLAFWAFILSAFMAVDVSSFPTSNFWWPLVLFYIASCSIIVALGNREEEGIGI